ncbi:MAG: hypothetical protein COX62_04555 [Deltaproteobacteria bacterium CG_4_10_14_0_2_um_filter_43_8]|nr:MAG: hypothetical protein COV43_04580 [Deltaproteobacteria bacterium CG11_big_fil_rev_8_21_14_0_20_42_23]PJA20516.1 MAG: hypothetical protein COX62_04555 [Deltaproteobacteria bacterium CG_4_10_14_0_2_um_filter_43_8]PJC65051.1 MAG: hypothetical protein CO021_00970 [Deltaproteobacteria bacterium CG_4_9_14_0_2_um_filter_42_21]
MSTNDYYDHNDEYGDKMADEGKAPCEACAEYFPEEELNKLDGCDFCESCHRKILTGETLLNFQLIKESMIEMFNRRFVKGVRNAKALASNS